MARRGNDQDGMVLRVPRTSAWPMPPLPHLPPPPTEALRVVQEAGYLTLALAQRLQANHARHAAALGLTAAQAKVLLALQPNEAVSQRALADHLGYDPSNLTGLIDKLEARAEVRRRPDAGDRRVKALLLTPAGTQTRTALWTALTNDSGPLAHLTPGQARAVRDRLTEALADTAVRRGACEGGSRATPAREQAQ